MQLGFVQQWAQVVFGSHIVVICPTRFAMVVFLVSFFGGSTKSTVEVKSQFKNGHLLLKHVSLMSPRPVTDTRLESLIVMVQSLTGTIRMPL